MAAGVKCGQLDITKIPEEDLLVDQNRLSVWVRSDVDEKIYTIPNDNNPYVVIKFSDACFTTLCDPDLTDINRSLLFFSNAVKSALEGSGKPVQDPSGGGSGTIGGTQPPADEQAESICGVDKAKLFAAQKGVDSTSINEKGYFPSAVMPAEAIIPMKSNIFTYGPYASSNFMTSFGGTQAEVNPDLCPWVFGSSALMNAAGQELVNKSIIGLVKAETGGVTVTGLPTIGSLGEAVASGPNLTSVNTTFGSSGITTNYEFRTYTPKLGNLSRAFIDRIKRIAKNRQDNIKLLRASNINQIKINRKIRDANRAARVENELAKPKKDKNSLSRVMIGEMYDFWKLSDDTYTQRTVVGAETLSKSVVEMRYDYAKKCFVSMDALFGPVSINGANNELPRYITPYTGSDILHHTSPIHAQPPLKLGQCEDPEIPTSHDEYNLRIHNLYLNPLANPGAIPHYNSSSSASSPGHSIDMVGRENEVPSSGLITNFYEPGKNGKYSNDYRFIGMRGPIILHAWGYDVDGKPIPNNIDNETDTKKGIFKTSDDSGGGLKDQFMKDWLQKPGTWPVGPIDLRFDRERGVWVSPQPFKIVVARVIKEVAKCGEGVGLLINKDIKRYGRQLFDKDGKALPENSQCKKEDYCGYENEYDQCSKWILISVGNCPGGGCDFDIQLSLVNNKLLLEYTCNGVTKSTFVPTTNCDGSSSSSSTGLSSSSTSSSNSSSSSSQSPSSSSSGSSEDLPLIKLVDRIGIKHNIGDMVYAYYDTYTHEYIILESNKSVSDNVIAYGYISASNTLTIEGYSGNGSVSVGDNITFNNPLQLHIPNCDVPIKAVIGKVKTC